MSPGKYSTEVLFPSQHSVAGVECGLNLCGAPAGGDAAAELCSPGDSEVTGGAAAEAPGAAPDRLCLPMSIAAAT